MIMPSSEPSGGDQSPGENAAVEHETVEHGTVEHVVDDGTIARPTFTPAAREADDGATARPTLFTPAAREAGDDAVPGDAAAEMPTVAEPAEKNTDADTDEAAPAYEAAPAAPVDGTHLDQPLLSADPEVLAQWQRMQAEFIDDPRVAVAGAADLVEQVGQALVDALQQRQRQMRTMWDRGSAAPGDTEQLRQAMLRYRALFNQLYQPA